MFDADKAVQATEADVIEWYKTKAELQKLQARERALREKIIKSYFPAPSEGTNKVAASGLPAAPLRISALPAGAPA